MMRTRHLHHPRTLLGVMTAGLIAASFVPLASADDWTTWRGPRADGTTQERGWDPQALARPGSVVWRTNVGRGHSAVAVQEERLYTMGLHARGAGEDAGYVETVYCLDVGDGRVVWRYDYPEQSQRFPGPGATPVLDGERLFTLGRNGQLYCFDARAGKVIWRRDLVEEGLAVLPDWGFCASPVVDGERLLLNARTAGLALSTRTGTMIWASKPGQGLLATPVLLERGGARLAAILGRESLNAVDVEDGTVRWSFEWQSYSDPVILGDSVLLTGEGRGKGSALLGLGGDGPVVRWKGEHLAGTFQSAVVWQGHAYGFGDVRSLQPLQCVQLATGELEWSEDLGQWGSLIIADGKLVILEGDGDLVIAAASPEAYREIARTKVFEIKRFRSYEPGDPKACWTAPVLANGKVYVRDTWGDLACVDLSAGPKS